MAKNDSKENSVAAAIEPVPPTMPNMGTLISHVQFPVTIIYNGEKVRISPRAMLEDADRNLLPEALPLGIIFIPKR